MGTLYNYVETFLGALPEALAWMRAQTSDGFRVTVETLLERAVRHLETNANNLRTSREDTITCVTIEFFNRYGIQATQQQNSRGHVDIFISHRFRPTFVICGEAKIWRYPAYHVDGLGQVLGYTTGRYPYCFLLTYVQKGAIKTHFETLQVHLDTNLPEAQQGPCSDHPTFEWGLLSNHEHRSGELVSVLHAGVNLA